MSYDYQSERAYCFTDQGVRDLFVLDDYLRGRRAVTTFEFFAVPGTKTPDSFKTLALIDRLVELGRLMKVGTGWRSDDAVYVVRDPN